jgi:hypothetical protein
LLSLQESTASFWYAPLVFLKKLCHALLVSKNAPHRLSASMENLNVGPTYPMAIPRPCILMVVIIQGYFLMISFLTLVGVLLISGATDKTQTNANLVDCNIGVKLKKIGPTHTLCPSSRISLGV